MENAKKFFEEVLKTKEAQTLLASVEKPKTEQEIMEAYLDVAKKLNVELTAEDIQAYITASSACVEDTDAVEVDDKELERIAGGRACHVFNTCKDTYLQQENCWWNDGCDQVYNGYTYYKCKYLNR